MSIGEHVLELKPVRESSILVCGTARNVSRKLVDFLLTTDKCFAGFKETQYLICESFSVDSTWEKLMSLKAQREDFHCIQDDQIDQTEIRRTVRIASARNQLKNNIGKNFDNFDYVVMMDLDGVNRNLTRASVESCWTHGGWAGVTANQPLRYYDIWALRAIGWCENDCWKEYANLRKDMKHKQALKIAVTSKMKSIRRSGLPIEVQSAFGGLAIYKMEAFLSSEYIGEDEQEMEICEHVPFHKGLTDKGFKIFIMPSLVNLNPMTQVGNMLKGLALRLIETCKKISSQASAPH
jgi:hypothetical protein